MNEAKLENFYKDVVKIVTENHGSVRTDVLEKALGKVDKEWWNSNLLLQKNEV